MVIRSITAWLNSSDRTMRSMVWKPRFFSESSTVVSHTFPVFRPGVISKRKFSIREILSLVRPNTDRYSRA